MGSWRWELAVFAGRKKAKLRLLALGASIEQPQPGKPLTFRNPPSSTPKRHNPTTAHLEGVSGGKAGSYG